MAKHDEGFDELNNFDEIESAGVSSTDLSLSNVYNVKIGGFGVQNSIRTYLSSVKVAELEDDIEFYEMLTKDKSWPVSQIIQREVDRIRVSEISKDYILGQGREVKYFPPLIIALLPKDSEGKIDLRFEYGADEGERSKEIIYERSKYRSNVKIKDMILKSENTSLTKGLYLLSVSKVLDFNLLCWSKNDHYAIIIDGQHRLASLIKSRTDNSSVSNYQQDVVFIDFSYLVQKSLDHLSPVEVVRRVFIDINTNAKRVSNVRQILMDDKDLSSLLVQSLVDASNSDGSIKSENAYLQSQIVDWYGESLKHTLPHLTGVLSLHQIIEDYLVQTSLSSIQDLRVPTKVEKWVNRMNFIFSVDSKIKTIKKFSEFERLEESFRRYKLNIDSNKKYEDELSDDSKESELFSFDYRVLDVARDTFDKVFLKPIIKFFNELTPYKLTIEIIKDNNGFNNDTLLSTALISSRNRIATNKSLKESISNLRVILEDKLFEKYYHIYTVLGQKVLFNLLFQRIFEKFNSFSDEEQLNGIADELLSELNRMFEIFSLSMISLLDKRDNVIIKLPSQSDLIDYGNVAAMFWEGIIYENGKIIYNTQGIRSLSSIFQYILSRIDEIINGKPKTKEFVISYMSPRIKRILTTTFGIYDERNLKKIQNKIISTKERFLEDYLTSAINLYLKQKK